MQLASLAFEQLGVDFRGWSISSTESDGHMSLGIPAIAVDGGGEGGGAHSPDEWFVPADSHLGPQASLLVILGLAGIDGVSDAQLKKL